MANNSTCHIQYLALAKWNVLNDPNCSDRVKSRLHLLFGKLFAVKEEYELAKVEYAIGIFCSSKCFGAESIATSSGYFSLGDVFYAQGVIENALAFYDKVVDIWYKYLSILHTNTLERHGGEAGGVGGVGSPENPTDAQLNDGFNQLKHIFETRKKLLGESHIASGEAEYCLGLFEFFLLRNEPNAALHMASALAIYESQFGDQHSSVQHVRAILSFVEMQMRTKPLN